MGCFFIKNKIIPKKGIYCVPVIKKSKSPFLKIISSFVRYIYENQ